MRARVFAAVFLAVGLTIFLAACGDDSGGGDGGDDWGNNPRLNASVPDPFEDLTDDAKQAVELAPSWLRYDLIDNLRKLTSQLQDEYSDLIINPDDERYRDEFAFLIAHTATGDLVSSSWTPELLIENVATAYENDEYLAYVEILDITEKDGDYYSTVEYAMPDGSSLELPRDFYYWFIIHQRIEDETPTYINPESGSADDPPDGVFWRTYFFTHADEDCQLLPGCNTYDPENPPEPYPCPVLKDMLQNALYMWEGHTIYNETEFNDNVEGTGALEIVTEWIMQVMHWGAYSSRPIQPVRIYHVHCGRCGEHADISDAAARTALLPAINVSALSNDHVWNEFFDNNFFELGTLWHEWEPVNWFINNFTSYDRDPDEGGWWPAFALFSTRGDGYTYNRTPDYSKTATIKVTVTDSQGKPVDGALVVLYGLRFGYMPVFAQLTDRNGFVEAKVGEGGYSDYPIKFYLRVKSELGDYPNFPSGNPALAATEPDVDEVIELDVQLENASAFPPFEDKEPEDSAGRYIAKLSYELTKAIMYGNSILGGTNFSDARDEGWATLLVFDRENYEKYAGDESAEPTAIKKISGSGTFEFDIPSPGCWYFILLNDSVNATQIGMFKFELFSGDESKLSREDEIFLTAGKAAIYELCGL